MKTLLRYETLCDVTIIDHFLQCQISTENQANTDDPDAMLPEEVKHRDFTSLYLKLV